MKGDRVKEKRFGGFAIVQAMDGHTLNDSDWKELKGELQIQDVFSR